MKLSCLQENLASGINMVGHLALKSSSLPILSNVLLKATKNSLILTATNLEAGIQHIVRGKIEEEGECLIPARLLLDLLPLLPGGPLTIKVTERGLGITTEKAKTTLHTTPSADFPIVPNISNGTTIMIPRQAMIEAINMTAFATGHVEQRPQFSGVLFSILEKTIVLVATDGYRLAEAIIKTPKNNIKTSFIVPLTTTQEVLRMLELPDQDETVSLVMGDNQIQFTCGSTQITSRLIDGEYPDYLPLFPEKPMTECQATKIELTRAVKAAGLFSRLGMSDVVLDIAPNSSKIEVYAENAEVGSHHMTVDSKANGQVVAITLNSRYLLDGLSAVNGSLVVLQLTGNDRPLLLLPQEESSAVSYRYLLMPIKQ